MSGNGDPDDTTAATFDELADRYYPMWVALARRVNVLGGAVSAEDIVNESLAEVWKQLTKPSGPTIKNLKAYITGVVLNKVRAHVRSKARHARIEYDRRYDLPDAKVATEAADELIMRGTIDTQVATALHKLSADEQYLFYLRAADFSYTEIAELLHLSEDAVRKRWSRLRLKLQAQLSALGWNLPQQERDHQQLEDA